MKKLFLLKIFYKKNEIIPTIKFFLYLSSLQSFRLHSSILRNSLFAMLTFWQPITLLPFALAPEVFTLHIPSSTFDHLACIGRRTTSSQSVLSICKFILHFWWTHSFLCFKSFTDLTRVFKRIRSCFLFF